MRVAAIASGYRLVVHDYVEIHGNAVKVVKAWFSDASQLGDIRPLAGNPEVFAKEFWYRVRPLGLGTVLLGAGFPCRELSQVNQSRRGLDHGDTARFQEATILFKALLDERQTGDPELRVIFENVQSMPKDARDRITRELRDIDPLHRLCGDRRCACLFGQKASVLVGELVHSKV